MTAQRVAVVGAKGMLARALVERLRADPAYVDPACFDLPDMDITDPATLDRPGLVDADVIFNCAGWTDVDGAESHRDAAFAVNRDGVAHLAAVAAARNALLVHISTDFVFDGNRDTPWPTDAAPSPLSVYGESKLAGERVLAESGCRFLLVRTAWLYGEGGPHFVDAMLRLAREHGALRVVCDQTGAPTWSRDLADGLVRLQQAGAEGIFHFTGSGAATRHQWACEIVRLAGLSVPVEPVTSEVFPAPARRPAYGVLDLTETTRVLGAPPRSWREALAEYLSSRAEAESRPG